MSDTNEVSTYDIESLICRDDSCEPRGLIGGKAEVAMVPSEQHPGMHEFVVKSGDTVVFACYLKATGKIENFLTIGGLTHDSHRYQVEETTVIGSYHKRFDVRQICITELIDDPDGLDFAFSFMSEVSLTAEGFMFTALSTVQEPEGEFQSLKGQHQEVLILPPRLPDVGVFCEGGRIPNLREVVVWGNLVKTPLDVVH